MNRLLPTSTLTLALLLGSLLLAQDEPRQQPPGFGQANDAGARFRRLDADGDGKLTREEYRAAFRLQSAREAADGLFAGLDADRDGSLSPQEYSGPAPGGFRPGQQPPRRPPPATPAVDAGDRPSPEGVTFFEKKIRPVLVDHCYKCHSAESDKVRGGLLLDTRAALRKGGDTGPAIVPGNPSRSLLVKALHYTDDSMKMPPKQKLPSQVIADFEEWVRMGAPDPRDGTTVKKEEIDIEKGRQFWAFQPPRKPEAPRVKNAEWARTDIDRFLLARLEEKGLKPVADADPATLLRRLHYDLIGLPPSPEEVETFLEEYKARPQQALEGLVDRLLSSSRFGERWGRHWLDVARFAESSGKEVSMNYPHAWRYRDYVIDAFNKDKPYDQFVREQVAGDLLRYDDEKQRAEMLIATGFLAIGTKSHNERSRTQFQMDLVDEQIDTTTQAFMALTVACARCHDHKFDPIPQSDYYAMAGIFRSTETCYGTVRILQSNHPAPVLKLTADAVPRYYGEQLTQAGRERLEGQIEDVNTQMEEMRRNATRDNNNFIRILFLRNRQVLTQSQLDTYEADGSPKQLAMGVRESFRISNSPLYQRGEIDKPGNTVPRGLPQIVMKDPPAVTRGSGRFELAQWLTSRDNPLTARVMANRVWLHLFGRGIVTTPDNFGAAGEKPSHPELLDHLAVSFMDEGWSVKKLIRRIVLSRAYQMSSRFDEQNFDADPDNVLVWRKSKRRIDAESLRDSILATSGRLSTSPPLGSTAARNGEGNARGGPGGFGGRRGFGGAPQEPTHRSIYLAVMRDQTPESLALFDFADPSMVQGERPTTTTPAQALYLMNNSFVLSEAEAAARRLLAEEGSDADRIRKAYLLFYSRPASDEEVKRAEEFLADYTDEPPPAVRPNPRGGRFGERGFRGRPGFGGPQAPRLTGKEAAWAALCQAMMASADFLYVNLISDI